jgi:hypothetical protein
MAAAEMADQRAANQAMTAAIGLDMPRVPAGVEVALLIASPQTESATAAVLLRRWRTSRKLGDAVAALEAVKRASVAAQFPEARYNLAYAVDFTSG